MWSFQWRDTMRFETSPFSPNAWGTTCLSEDMGEQQDVGPMVSHMFSIGLRSGERAGYMIQCFLSLFRQFWTVLARWQGALSSTKEQERWTWGTRISEIYLSWIMVHVSSTCSVVWPLTIMPVCTKMLQGTDIGPVILVGMGFRRYHLQWALGWTLARGILTNVF